MKEKIIIIVHTDYPWTEGMSYRVHNMACFLCHEYDVIVVAPILESSYRQGFEFNGQYGIYRVMLNVIDKLKANRILYRLLFVFLYTLSMIRIHSYFEPRHKIKLVQAEQQLALLPGTILSLLLGAPLIMDDALFPERYYMDYPRFLRFFTYLFEMIFLHKCQSIICSSNNVSKSIYKRYNFPLLKLHIILNGVETIPNIEQNVAQNNTTKEILFIGSMYSQQNRRAICNLFRIFQSIVAVVKDARLVIIGGPLYLLHGIIISIIGYSPSNILILGQISESEKKKYITRASVCVLPYSPNDRLIGGIRLKALEFLSYGKVVVSTSTGVEGIDGAITGENMLISDDLKSLKDNIVQVLEHPERYELIRKNAVKLAAKYNWKNILPSYKAILEDLVSDRGKGDYF